MTVDSSTPRSVRLAAWLVAVVMLVSAIAIIVANGSSPIRHYWDVPLLVLLSFVTYVVGTGRLALPSFQIDVGLSMALAALVLTGPVGALLTLAIPELTRPWIEGRSVRRIAIVANLASYAWEVVIGEVVLLALATAGTSLVGRCLGYALVAVAMVLPNFAVTRGIVAGLVDRVLISGWRVELRALLTCLALAPFAALTAALLPVIGVLALVAVALAEACLGLLVHLVTWTPRAGGLTVAEARSRYAAALASRLELSRSERRVLLGAARWGSGMSSLLLPRADERDRIAKTLLLAGLWTGAEDCFSRLGPVEMGLESRILLVAHGWAELTARGTEQLEHRLALLTLHNNPRRYDRSVVSAARDLVPDAARSEQNARIPCAGALPRRIAQFKLAA
jgi:hypothetical protein